MTGVVWLCELMQCASECRQMESEMIGDGQGCADEADEVYHDTLQKVHHLALWCRGG